MPSYDDDIIDKRHGFPHPLTGRSNSLRIIRLTCQFAQCRSGRLTVATYTSHSIQSNLCDNKSRLLPTTMKFELLYSKFHDQRPILSSLCLNEGYPLSRRREYSVWSSKSQEGRRSTVSMVLNRLLKRGLLICTYFPSEACSCVV